MMVRKSPGLRALALLVALLFVPLIVPAESGEEALSLYINAGETARVYEAADESSAVLRLLQPGEAFEMRSSQGGWAEIRVFTEGGEMLRGWTPVQNLRSRTAEDGYSAAVIAPENPEDRPVLRARPQSGASSLGRYFPGVVARVLAQPEPEPEAQASAPRFDDEFSNPQPHWHHSPETLQ